MNSPARKRIRPKSILICVAMLCSWCGRSVAEEQDFNGLAAPMLQQFCVECHGNQGAEAKVNLELLTREASFETSFETWRKVVEMLDNGKMPPEDANQLTDVQRQQLSAIAREKLRSAAERHAEDPGPVTLRRITSAEYAYSIHDLIGVDLDFGRDFVPDAVGGEGFANVGSVQFMQDSTLERYLDAAKQVASYAVIGAGPLDFYKDPGQTGFELSAITRIQAIYRQHGFRTAAGEGGEAFGLDRYARAFYTAWQFRHRDKLGLEKTTLRDLALEEGIDARFAEYIWSVLNDRTPSYPMTEITERWRDLPAPTTDGLTDDAAKVVRLQCDQIYRVVYDWQTRFGQNPDAKEEAPVLAVDSFDVHRSKLFEMNINWPKGTKTAHLQLKIESANRDGKPNAVVIWRKPTIQFRIPDQRLNDPVPLSSVVAAESANVLAFGKHPSGRSIERHDFVTMGTLSPTFDLPILAEATSARLLVTAELDVKSGDDCIIRCTISQKEETDQGKQVSALLANPKGAAFSRWRAGVLDFARMLPQVSHREPAPSDRDPIPALFDNTYNNSERNDYHYKIKYNRDDKFLVDNILDDATRERLNQAWADLLGSFKYHDTYLRFVAKKYDIDLANRTMVDLEPDWIDSLDEAPRDYVRELASSYRAVQTAFKSAEARHLEDVLQFASRAWRRPLADDEQERLREFYRQLARSEEPDHRQAIRALLTRVLVAPEFLYRTEHPHDGRDVSPSPAEIVALSDWELASRLSYALWSSVPDAELRRLAAAGELSNPGQLSEQVRRMLRDPKSRRFAAEFFGQWFGFYQFDRYRGIDPERFPEFTDSLKGSMHNEAVSFFEYIVRNDRPVNEILFADYAFLNEELATHYGIDAKLASNDLSLVSNVRDQRGGLLGLGAVLTVTSAPMRTSPVRRGDWLLRRVLGTPVPPPPADAGSIPADDVVADGLTVRTRLEAHRRVASCNNCHSRIDPLGFALEQYDTLGRWREEYRDGGTIETSSILSDGSRIAGVDGLRAYLQSHQQLFHRTFCKKLVGYTFGRRESISDVLLIEKMMTDIEKGGRFLSIVERVVTSRQFRYRRSGDDEQPQPEIEKAD
jgi:hypothetical protein